MTGMDAGDQAIATVTGKDLLASINGVTEKLARIEYAVDNIPGKLDAQGAKIERNTEDIAALKQWRAFWTGVTSVAALLLTAGVVSAIITALHR